MGQISVPFLGAFTTLRSSHCSFSLWPSERTKEFERRWTDFRYVGYSGILRNTHLFDFHIWIGQVYQPLYVKACVGTWLCADFER
jgi:hypothetical protein